MADNDQAGNGCTGRPQQGHVAAQFNYAMLLKAQPAEVYFWLGMATPHLTGNTKETSKQLREKAGKC